MQHWVYSKVIQLYIDILLQILLHYRFTTRCSVGGIQLTSPLGETSKDGAMLSGAGNLSCIILSSTVYIMSLQKFCPSCHPWILGLFLFLCYCRQSYWENSRVCLPKQSGCLDYRCPLSADQRVSNWFPKWMIQEFPLWLRGNKNN